MTRTCLFFLLIISPLSIFGQIEQPGRFEVELDVFEDEYYVQSGNENGLLVYKPSNIYDGGNELWYFIKLDTALNIEWEKEYYIDRSHVYRGYDYSGSSFSLLFQITEKSSLDLLLIQIDEYNGDSTHHRIKNLVTIQLEEFEMNPEAAVIGGYYNSDPVIIHYDLRTRKTKVLPGIYGNKTELIQIRVDDDFINILLSAKTFDNKNTITLKTYDRQGEYLSSYTFKPEDDTGLVFGRIANLGMQGTLVVGTYGGRRSDFSRGLFIGEHRGNDEQELRYYNYADLDNFFAYMKAKRQQRISEKITRKKVKGKKVKFNYRLLVHDIIKNGDEYIMLGEAFYPKYNGYSTYNRYSAYGSSDYSGRDYMPPTNFAGYRYTHAVVIGFNDKAEVLWDNSFQIEDVLSWQLEQYVHADILDDKIVLFYLYESQIRTKIISGSEVLEGKSFNNMRLSFGDDVIQDKGYYANIGGLEKWYDHNFYAYGVQKIKNLRDTGVKLNRRVFYINKIRYDHSYSTPLDEQSTDEILDSSLKKD